MKKRLASAAAFLFVFAALILLVQRGARIAPHPDIFQISGYTMGTTFSLQLVLGDEFEADARDELLTDVEALLLHLDKGLFSTYESSSELSRFNQAAVNEPFEASPEMLEILQLAQEIYRLSDGAFDVTVGPLVNLWGFGPDIVAAAAQQNPRAYRINAMLQRVGFDKLRLNSNAGTLLKTAELYVDLSGIAKGYAVDQLAAYFDDRRIDNYFLEVGGELKIKGRKPDLAAPGEEWLSWVPAIERPLDSPSPEVYEIFYTNGETLAVAGSGDYRNYFERDGIRYSHEIDPRVGYPVRHNLAAAYVIDRSAARADALATAFMVLGLEQSVQLADELGLASYFISKASPSADASLAEAEFNETYTAAFSRYMSQD